MWINSETINRELHCLLTHNTSALSAVLVDCRRVSCLEDLHNTNAFALLLFISQLNVNTASGVASSPSLRDS